MFPFTPLFSQNFPEAGSSMASVRHFNPFDATGTALRVEPSGESLFTGYTVPNDAMIQVVGSLGEFSQVVCPRGSPRCADGCAPSISMASHPWRMQRRRPVALSSSIRSNVGWWPS